jgi:hypothetical protein
MDPWELLRKRLSGELPPPGPPFDAAITPGILAFEIVVLLACAAALAILPRFRRRLWIHAGVVALAVLIFEVFTGPMWRNLHMGRWAYLYQQTSWILTLGWTCLILAVSVLVDHLLPARTELCRFGIKLALLTPVVFGLEILLGAIGLRAYAPEVWESVSGVTVAGVPVEALYYVPVFLALILGFHGYWSYVIDGEPVAPRARTPWLRLALTTGMGVLLFEIMIEPMVRNVGFPRGSYLYHDVTVVLTALWMAVIGLSVALVERRFIHWDLGHRFLATLAVMAVVAAPIEAALITGGFRVYGPSASERFSSLTLPFTRVPVEVFFAIPLYLALVLGLVRYLEIARSNPRTRSAA